MKPGLLTVSFPGAEFLEQALRDLGSDAEIRKSLGDSLLASGEPMARAARDRAPKGKTKRLAESIDISKTLSRRQRRNSANKQGPTEATVYVGAKPIGPSVILEFGTAQRHWKTGKSTGFVAPRPFMRPAFEETKNQVIDLLGKYLWINIEKAANRIKRRQSKDSP